MRKTRARNRIGRCRGCQETRQTACLFRRPKSLLMTDWLRNWDAIGCRSLAFELLSDSRLWHALDAATLATGTCAAAGGGLRVKSCDKPKD